MYVDILELGALFVLYINGFMDEADNVYLCKYMYIFLNLVNLVHYI